MKEQVLAVLVDGPFRGGTYAIAPGAGLAFDPSWLNPAAVVYGPTGETVDTDEGEAVVLRTLPGEAGAGP